MGFMDRSFSIVEIGVISSVIAVHPGPSVVTLTLFFLGQVLGIVSLDV